MRIATGSVCELETQLLIALDVDQMTEDTGRPLLNAVDEVKRMLHALEAAYSRRT